MKMSPSPAERSGAQPANFPWLPPERTGAQVDVSPEERQAVAHTFADLMGYLVGRSPSDAVRSYLGTSTLALRKPASAGEFWSIYVHWGDTPDGVNPHSTSTPQRARISAQRILNQRGHEQASYYQDAEGVIRRHEPAAEPIAPQHGAHLKVRHIARTSIGAQGGEFMKFVSDPVQHAHRAPDPVVRLDEMEAFAGFVTHPDVQVV